MRTHEITIIDIQPDSAEPEKYIVRTDERIRQSQAFGRALTMMATQDTGTFLVEITETPPWEPEDEFSPETYYDLFHGYFEGGSTLSVVDDSQRRGVVRFLVYSVPDDDFRATLKSYRNKHI